MSLCNICLRTNLTVNSVGNPLIHFYDNLLDHQMFSNLTVCATCKQLLERCYDFKQLCQGSNRILQDWKKKKKLQTAIETLHSLIEPYYDKVLKTIDDENKIKTDSENITILVVTNNENTIANNDDDETEFITNKCNKLDDDGAENNTDLFQINDILKKSIELSHSDDTDLNLNDDEHNGIEDNNDNERNGIEDNNDNELNGIGDNSDNECNEIENNSDNQNNIIGDDSNNDYGTGDDSIDDLEIFNKLLQDAKQKTLEINEQIQEMKKDIEVRKKEKPRKPILNIEDYKSVFDIVVYNSRDDAKADLMERPNSDYYKNAVVKCTICYTVFKSQKTLDYHMRWHDPSAGEHVCEICEMRYTTHKSLRNHKTHAHFGSFKCKKCPLFTHYWTTMLKHYKVHQGILYKCKYCDVTTSRNHETYLTHLRNFHPSIYHQTNNVCTLCGRTFVSPSGLRVHKGKVHRITEDVETDSSMRCDKCDLTFANQEAYTVHVMKTPGHKDVADTMIACSTCGKRFDDELSLGEHKRKEHPIKKCITVRSYKRGGGKITVTCKECGATGSNNSWLYNHCRRKHPKLPYKVTLKKEHLCDQCGKSFNLRCNLMAHQRVHTGERPHACADCGRTFITKLTLFYHRQTHKPPTRVCTVCGKKFATPSTLYNHMRTHTGDRRYKCSDCGKGFLHNWALQEHVRGVHLHVRRVKKQRRQKEQTPED